MHDFREKLNLKRTPKHQDIQKAVKLKHTYRIKAHNPKDQLFFMKVRTKAKMRTVRRVATFRGLTPDRITK